MIHCTFCGKELECEYEGLDRNGRLEQYHCEDCDTLYTLSNDSISYIMNATKIFLQVANDLELMKKNNFINNL